MIVTLRKAIRMKMRTLTKTVWTNKKTNKTCPSDFFVGR